MDRVARRRGVVQVYGRPDDLRLGDCAADGTCPRGAAMARRATLVTSSSWGEALDDVTFAATGTQQYLWGSNHATSECGLITTLSSDAALEAVSSGERKAFGRYTPCGHQCMSHPQMDLMALRAVIYSAPHTAVERSG